MDRKQFLMALAFVAVFSFLGGIVGGAISGSGIIMAAKETDDESSLFEPKEIKYLEEDFFGFPSSQDRLAWDSFHKCDSWDEKIQIKFKDQFADRYKACN